MRGLGQAEQTKPAGAWRPVLHRIDLDQKDLERPEDERDHSAARQPTCPRAAPRPCSLPIILFALHCSHFISLVLSPLLKSKALLSSDRFFGLLEVI